MSGKKLTIYDSTKQLKNALHFNDTETIKKIIKREESVLKYEFLDTKMTILLEACSKYHQNKDGFNVLLQSANEKNLEYFIYCLNLLINNGVGTHKIMDTLSDELLEKINSELRKTKTCFKNWNVLKLMKRIKNLKQFARRETMIKLKIFWITVSNYSKIKIKIYLPWLHFMGKLRYLKFW